MGISNQFGISRASSPGSISDPRMGTISSGGPTFLAKLISDISVNAGKGPITVPTIGDSNGDRWGFNGSVWTETDAEQPRFYNGALYMEGSHTELSGYSGDIGSWSTLTTASVAQNAVGLRGNSNEAFTVTDNSAVAVQFRGQNTAVSSSSSTYYVKVVTPYNASPAVYPRFRHELSGGTGVVTAGVFDPSDGSVNVLSGSAADFTSVRVGDWWFVFCKVTDNGTGNTSLQMRLDPAYNTDGSGTQDNSAQGSTVFASCELYKDSPSYAPILTTGGSTKTVNSDDEYDMPEVNFPSTHSGEVKLTTFFNGALSSAPMILDFGGGKGIRYGTTAKSIELYDGTNTVTLSNAWSDVGENITLKWIFDASRLKMNLSADGTAATEGTYDPITATEATLMDITGAAAASYLKAYPVSLGDGWLGS